MKGNILLFHVSVERKSAQFPRLGLKPVKGKAPIAEQSWFMRRKGADEYFILHPSIMQPSLFLYCIITPLLFQMKAIPAPGMDLDTRFTKS